MLSPVTSETSETSVQRSLDHWPQLFGLAFATAVGAYLFNTAPILIGVVAIEFGFAEDQLGLIAGAGGLGSFLCYASSFLWVHRVPLRKSIGAGALILLVATGGLFLADSFELLVLVLFVANLGGAIIYVSALTAMGSTSFPTRAFAISITFQVLLAAFLVFLVPGWSYPNFGWPGAVALYVSPGLLMLLVLRLIPESNLAVAEVESRHVTVPARMVWVALAACSIYFLGLTALWTFIERVGNEAGLDSGMVGSVIGIGLLVGVIGCVWAAFSKMSMRLVLVVVYVLYLVMILLLSGDFGLLAFGCAVVLLNTVWNFSLPFQWSTVAALGGPRYVALIPVAIAAGGGLGAAAGGNLITWGGYSYLYIWFVVFIGISLLLFGYASRGVDLAKRSQPS